MSKSKNNFTDPNVLAKVEYHCWVLHVSGAKWNNYHLPKNKTYNGFISKRDKGLQSLKDLVIARSSIIEQAQIWDSKRCGENDDPLFTWNPQKKIWE
ncbi:MAG: hypothetical protein Q7W13_13165 [Bacteroidia bacterium]|nr:hypothetical protein [Bacteroidia bacterium]